MAKKLRLLLFRDNSAVWRLRLAWRDPRWSHLTARTSAQLEKLGR